MNVAESRCTACGNTVSISVAAAWPERCPHCHATPLATRSGISIPTGKVTDLELRGTTAA